MLVVVSKVYNKEMSSLPIPSPIYSFGAGVGQGQGWILMRKYIFVLNNSYNNTFSCGNQFFAGKKCFAKRFFFKFYFVVLKHV